MRMRPFIIALSMLACSATQAEAHGIDAISVGLFFGPMLSLITGIACAIGMPGKLLQGFTTFSGSFGASIGTAFALGAVSPLLGDNGIVLGAIVGLCLCACMTGAIVANRLARKERVLSAVLAVLAAIFVALLVALVYGSFERLAIRFA